MKAKEFIITEGVAGPKNCWPGYRKTGTQPGTGKNKGKRVNDCEKIKEDEVEESGLQYYTGVKKHGKEYMTKSAQAARDGASQKELGALKDKYSKAYKKEGVEESEKGSRTVKHNSKTRNPVAHAAQKVAKGSGPHTDKKKADQQGSTKHKKNLATMEADEGNKIEQLESLISQLEQLMPAVANAQKNHYEFEEMESEMNAIAEAASALSDRSAIVDITDAVENAVGQLKQANASIYEIEKTLKGLIKHAGYALDDARDEAQYESRFGGLSKQK